MSRYLISVALIAFLDLSAACFAASGSNSCDLNSDGVLNVSDAQIAINEVLGILPCTNGDLDGSGRCDVVDVQREINAVLGGPCVASQPMSGTCAVTSPTAGSTQSGVVTWTANVSSLPGATSVDWILDDFHPIGHVTATPWSLVGYNTGWNLDGPGNVKIIVRDGTGSPICTSTDVPFVTQNFGITVTMNAPASLQSVPTVSGNFTFDMTTTAPETDVANGEFAIDGIHVTMHPTCYPTSHTYCGRSNGGAITYDTTQLVNGLHSAAWTQQCLGSSVSCGAPQTAGGIAVQRIFAGGVINVQNGHTLRGVQPNITDITMTVGETFQLSPVLAFTDGTTAPGTFTYALDHACLLQESDNPQLPFQCITGNTHDTIATAEGTPYVSVSPGGLITALAKGETFINIIDTVSGKVSVPVIVTVKASKNVPHFGPCGAIYTTYHAGGACPSTLLTSLFNVSPLDDAQTRVDLVKSGYTAFETQFHEQPQTYGTFASWLAAWQQNWQNPITNAMNAMPGMCALLRGENYAQQPRDLIELQQGPSASWSPSDPLSYELNQLAATGRICGINPRDESEAGLGGNNYYNYKFSDGSLTSIVVTGGTATFNTAGQFNLYGGWTRFEGSPVFVRNATTPGFNGKRITNKGGYFCAEWNAILQYNGPTSRDADCANNPSHLHTWTAPVDAADGVYTASTDPNLEVLGWGSFTGYAGQVMLNDNFKFTVDRARAAGIPTAWCTVSNGDFTTDLMWQGNPAVADYFCKYVSFNREPSIPWGRSFWEKYEVYRRGHWGYYTYSPSPSTSCCYWRNEGRGYTIARQEVPHSVEVSVNAESFALGGRQLTIASISGGILTSTVPHNIAANTRSVMNSIKVTLNSDNSHWNAYVTGPNTLRLFYKTLYCAPAGALGTVTFRGVTYNITNHGGNYGQLNLDHSFPTDAAPGELVTISGAGTSCANGTFAFNYFPGQFNNPPAFNGISLSLISTISAGSGGTFLVNDDQGEFNPLYDVNYLGGGRLGGGGVSANVLLLAGWGYAAMRGYMSESRGAAQEDWNDHWINDGRGIQAPPLSGTNESLNHQQRWWDISQGFNFVKRLSPFYLQTQGPAPFIAPGPPWIVTSLTTSASYGNILNVISFSEMPQTVSVPLGSTCQVGSNPVSVYRASFPHATTELLTGAQGDVSYTLDPGEAIAFACHASGTQSNVRPFAITYNPPAGTVTTAVQYTYGNYPGPLQQYNRSVICASSPCFVNLDTNVSDVYYNLLFLDASNAVISRAGPIDIPLGSR